MNKAALLAAALTLNSQCVFSPSRIYRYVLARDWDIDKPRICFIMLNPSTADEVKNDPTVERCFRRAVMWGYGAIRVLNIFALRSTDPAALYRSPDPIGPENDSWIGVVAKRCATVICGWGDHGSYLNRGNAVLHALSVERIQPFALKINASGHPSHPLYIPYKAKPTPMRLPNAA